MGKEIEAGVGETEARRTVAAPSPERARAVRWPSLHRHMQVAGLDHETLGAKVARSARAVGGWVRGERLPHTHFLPILAAALVTDPDPDGQRAAAIQAELQADAPTPKSTM